MALDGAILDLDGTLVDSNAIHVEAWVRAFARYGYRLNSDRIFTEIGKGGDNLVPALLGAGADRKDGDALRKAQPEEFARMAADGLRVFPGAQRLLEALRAKGLRTVLATSSAGKQLKTIESASGLPVRELFDELVTADDIQRSKPAPVAVAIAVEKLGMTPAQCVMIGDTVYDAQAAKDAGVVCLGLLCGGNSAQSLRSAGARQTYDDAADLLAHLDDALSIASPGSAHLTQDVLENLMRQALRQADAGMTAGEAPIGCVLARGDGEIVAGGFNEMNGTQNKTAHAEIVTFARAAGKVALDSRDLILVSTLEPCVMCTGAAMEAAVDTIVYGLRAPADSGTNRVRPPSTPESQMPRIVGEVLRDESRRLFEQWLDKNQGTPQAGYVKQMLEMNRARK